MEGSEEDSGGSGAEQAFEELRVEVKVLRRAIGKQIGLRITLKRSGRSPRNSQLIEGAYVDLLDSAGNRN